MTHNFNFHYFSAEKGKVDQVPESVKRSKQWRFAVSQNSFRGNSQARCWYTGDRTSFVPAGEFEKAMKVNGGGLLMTVEHLVPKSKHYSCNDRVNLVVARRDVNELLANTPLFIKERIRQKFYNENRIGIAPFDVISDYFHSVIKEYMHAGVLFWNKGRFFHDENQKKRSFWTLENTRAGLDQIVLSMRTHVLWQAAHYERKFLKQAMAG